MGKTSAERQKKWRRAHPALAREVSRSAKQKLRDKLKEAAKSPVIRWPDPPADPAGAVADWAKDTLIVPPGHPKAGQPFELPEYLVDFFRSSLAADTQESLLCIARKNSKSGAVAVLLLAYLVGPLMQEGWRCGVASLSREKASELKMQVEAIALASNLEGIEFWRRSSPAITAAGGSIDILSADRNAAAAGGWTLSICDEIGLMHEKHRELVNSLRSSVSARGGRFMALSVWGDGPFCGEIVKRRDDPGVVVHLHQAPEDCALDDESAWAAANPGLAAGIKQRSYMVSESRRVLATPSDQASFRALDLNLPGAPSRELVCSPTDWKKCVVNNPSELPPRAGRCFVGVDIGGSASMCAASSYWPETKRLELYAALPATPNLIDRGQADGVGGIYQEAFERGELQVYAGRITPAGDFVRHVAASLSGCEVAGAASDNYRRPEVLQVIEADEIDWPWDWRRMGMGPTGSADVSSFQKAIFSREIRTVPSLLMPLAMKSTVLSRDGNGNPSLNRSNTGRIDVLAATVLALGLAAEQGDDSEFSVCQRSVT